jgi:hypothetical protein
MVAVRPRVPGGPSHPIHDMVQHLPAARHDSNTTVNGAASYRNGLAILGDRGAVLGEGSVS